MAGLAQQRRDLFGLAPRQAIDDPAGAPCGRRRNRPSVFSSCPSALPPATGSDGRSRSPPKPHRRRTACLRYRRASRVGGGGQPDDRHRRRTGPEAPPAPRTPAGRRDPTARCSGPRRSRSAAGRAGPARRSIGSVISRSGDRYKQADLARLNRAPGRDVVVAALSELMVAAAIPFSAAPPPDRASARPAARRRRSARPVPAQGSWIAQRLARAGRHHRQHVAPRHHRRRSPAPGRGANRRNRTSRSGPREPRCFRSWSGHVGFLRGVRGRLCPCRLNDLIGRTSDGITRHGPCVWRDVHVAKT